MSIRGREGSTTGLTFGGDEAVLGAAEADTGGRGEQSGAVNEADKGPGAAGGDKASGKKRKRGKQATWGKRQAMAKQRATDERREQAGASGTG